MQIDVAINKWFGDFYNLIQNALTKPGSSSINQFNSAILQFAGYAGLYVFLIVVLSFITKHWTFRWRQAMNDFYLENWFSLRAIEGSSQRIQEDTKRFAILMETVGASLLEAILTLLAFLPILWELSRSIIYLPILGEVKHSLVFVAIFVAIIGTVGLALIGFKLPGLEFENQVKEAAYRKELVYSEDNLDRGEINLLNELFMNVRNSYFKLYFHYLYFDVFRHLYLQFTVIVPYLIVAPTIISGLISLGMLQQIVRAFQRVEMSFIFLVRNWPTIIELISVYKRLKLFSASIKY